MASSLRYIKWIISVHGVLEEIYNLNISINSAYSLFTTNWLTAKSNISSKQLIYSLILKVIKPSNKIALLYEI